MQLFRFFGEYSECLCFKNMQGIYEAFEGKDCGLPIYHPRKLVNQTLIDRGGVMRVSQTWPAILAPALVVASIATFFIARACSAISAACCGAPSSFPMYQNAPVNPACTTKVTCRPVS